MDSEAPRDTWVNFFQIDPFRKISWMEFVFLFFTTRVRQHRLTEFVERNKNKKLLEVALKTRSLSTYFSAPKSRSTAAVPRSQGIPGTVFR